MSKKLYIFDFDDTIVNSLPLCFTCFRIVFYVYNQVILSDSELEALFGASEETIIQKNLNDQTKVVEAQQLFYFLYAELHDQYIDQRQLKNFLTLADYLKSNDKLIAVFTGKGKKDLGVSLAKLNLTQIFDYIVTDDDVKLSKPSGEGITKILQDSGCRKQEAIFIGDTDADILAARDAGVTAVGVNWYKKRDFLETPDLISNSPADLQIEL